MANVVQLPRGTRAALNALAAANGLVTGREYLITDEGRVAVATSVSAYQAYAKQSEIGGGSGTSLGVITALNRRPLI